ncbi:MAG: hypothetical protein FJX52_17150 [Alphaproteobacteria bacterium]|nr:hypothetical protein [Alphaproteobacteria bacterium]
MANSAVAEAPAAPPMVCASWVELCGPSARRTIGRIAAPYLDDAQTIPTLLLHDYGSALRLFQAGDTLNNLLEAAARSQMRLAGASFDERLRALAELADGALHRIRELQGAVAARAATVAELNERAVAANGAGHAMAWLARDVAAPSWAGKLDRLLDVLSDALDGPAIVLLDQVLAEILERTGARAVIVAPSSDFDGRLRTLVGLL